MKTAEWCDDWMSETLTIGGDVHDIADMTNAEVMILCQTSGVDQVHHSGVGLRPKMLTLAEFRTALDHLSDDVEEPLYPEEA